MGKGTDKLYITHSEWGSDSAYSASVGAKSKSGSGASRLPFRYCALSLQPFNEGVCVAGDGPVSHVFDLDVLLAWLDKHGTHPVTGQSIGVSDFIRLKIHRNEGGEFVDPVTFKALTDNSHVVVNRASGQVYLWDTIAQLNIKPRNWQDLVTDQSFTRKDILTLQDPHGQSTVKTDTSLELRQEESQSRSSLAKNISSTSKTSNTIGKYINQPQVGEPNAVDITASGERASQTARHTTGQTAASLTSTSLTPQTSASLAELTPDDYLFQHVCKSEGHAIIKTSSGDLSIILTTYAPKTVFNFCRLAKNKYYNGVKFHRNIPGFMLQGGDPTGTGRGGSSAWGHPFADEWATSPLTHNARGVLSMANKGKNTNTSQFFLTYRACPHLDRKHTIFGRLSEDSRSQQTLNALEAVTKNDPIMHSIDILIDPFEEQVKMDRPATIDVIEPAKKKTKVSRGFDDW